MFILLKVVVRLIVSLSSANLICRSTDISKCFIESLGVRDNESRLYIGNFTTKNENFQIKNSGSFHISAQNIDCEDLLEPPLRGSSNKYHNLCFWAEVRKLMYTPVNPSFTVWKWGLRESKLHRRVLMMKLTSLAKKIWLQLFQFCEWVHYS